MWWLQCLWQLLAAAATTADTPACGGLLRSPRGVLQTPGFPAPFPVPFRCQWIIDNSQQDNSFVVVYLTQWRMVEGGPLRQVFVTTGLSFSELGRADEVGAPSLLLRPTAKWLRSSRPYLLVDFSLDRLEGRHLRAVDGLLDVYGFNMSYEVARGGAVAARTCSVLDCSFSGHCYSAPDFRNFYCACFKGFYLENCRQGPLCRSSQNDCQNNATCRQFGSAVAYYHPECREEIHIPGCPQTNNVPRWAVYTITMKQSNFSATNSSGLHKLVWEHQITKCLMDNLTNATELRITNLTSEGKVVFSLLVSREAKTRIRENLNGLSTRKCLWKYSFDLTNITIREEPLISLQNIRTSHGKTVLREGDEFSISCSARGSSSMIISWLKDGVVVNISNAIRNMRVETRGPDSSGTYTSVLGVGEARVLDGGTFTCRATDWGMQTCLSLRLDVLRPPEVTVLPRSLTVEKGMNAQLICMSRDDGKFNKFKYKWIQNETLIPMSPGKIVWEDLQPLGTLLNIYNVQESGWYACRVEDGAASSELVVSVAVASAEACVPQRSAGLQWPRAAAGTAAELACPAPLAGVARRPCDAGRWGPPDLSGCLHPQFARLRDDFEKLTLGYPNTTILETLIHCLGYLKQRKSLYPGEGEQIVPFLDSVQKFSATVTERGDFSDSVNVFYKILNILLETSDNIKSKQSMLQLQEILVKQSVLCSSMLRDTKYCQANLSMFVVEVQVNEKVKLLQHYFPQKSSSNPSWMKVKLNITIEMSNYEYFKSGNITTVIIMYHKNLSVFLPENSITKQRNKQEPLNTAALPTQLVVKVLVDGEDWRSRMGSFAACLRVAREQPPRSTPAGWRPQCVETSSPAAPSSCGTAVSGDNYTRCLCRRPGAYAVISAPFQPRVERAPDDDQSLSAAVLGCSFCLAQTLFALALLLPCWWRHRDCFVFLKLQCCTATSGAMAVFIYGVRNSSNKIAYPYIAASLEAFLLIGTTSHVGKVLIVYIEVVQLSRSRHVNKIIVIITTGLSLLAVLCDRLIYHLLGWAQTSWWLLFGTKMFIMFTTIVSLTLAVYLFLYISVTSKLRVFSRSMTLDSRTVSIRMRFLNTGAIVLFFTVIMEASSILFINIHIVPYSYIFGCSCTLLGFTIVACYLWKSEVPVCAWMMHDVPPTQAISEENISTTTQPKCVSTNREIDQEVPTMLWSSTIQNLVKICTNIRQLMTKTSNESATAVPLNDVNTSTVETITSISGDFLDDTVPSGLHASTSALRCSAVKGVREKRTSDSSTARSSGHVQDVVKVDVEPGTAFPRQVNNVTFPRFAEETSNAGTQLT